MSSFPGGASASAVAPGVRWLGQKRDHRGDRLSERFQVDAVLPADTVAPWCAGFSLPGAACARLSEPSTDHFSKLLDRADFVQPASIPDKAGTSARLSILAELARPSVQERLRMGIAQARWKGRRYGLPWTGSLRADEVRRLKAQRDTGPWRSPGDGHQPGLSQDDPGRGGEHRAQTPISATPRSYHGPQEGVHRTHTNNVMNPAAWK
jgi:hypothetical protein